MAYTVNFIANNVTIYSYDRPTSDSPIVIAGYSKSAGQVVYSKESGSDINNQGWTTLSINPGTSWNYNNTGTYVTGSVIPCSSYDTVNLYAYNNVLSSSGQDTVYLPSLPKSGYTQGQWAIYNGTEGSGYIVGYQNSGSTMSISLNVSLGFNSYVSYRPTYTRRVYIITLDSAPGSGGTDKIYYWNGTWYSDSNCTNEITSNYRISLPSRTGYSFSGYGDIIDDNGAVDTSKSVDSDISLVASWTAKTYTVSFDINGNITQSSYPESIITPSSVADIQVTYDSAYPTLTTLSRYGFDFDGWYTNAIGGTQISSESIYKIDNDSTIYAHWTKKKYNIKAEIDSDGLISVKVGNSTSGISSTEEVEYWDSVTLVAELDSHDPGPGSEWAFDSWKLSNSTVSNSASYTIDHVTLSNTYKAYAYMGVKKFILTIKREDESIKGVRFENYPLTNKQQMPDVTFGQTIIIHAVPENGNIGYCVFDGWYKDGSLISSDADTSYKVTGNDILIAKGHIEIPRYKIDLKNNGCNNTNQNGGVVSITYEDGYGYNSGSKQVNPGETKSFYVLRNLPNNSSLKLKVEDIEYGYQFKNWVKDGWSSTDLEWEIKTVTQPGTYEANFELWNLDGATWKGYYIFVKTSDPDLPWKIVKEIDVRVKEGAEEEWKLSSKAPSQP